MTRAVTEDDVTLATIGEQVRQQVLGIVERVMEESIAGGARPALAADACAAGLVALAVAFATVEHEPGCEGPRAFLHASVDVLFGQLDAFDHGRINADGETVQ